MSDEQGVVFRGVVKVSGSKHVWNRQTGKYDITPGPYLKYSRPYDTVSPAKAAVTKMRKNNSRGFIDGWVEYSTEWKRLED